MNCFTHSRSAAVGMCALCQKGVCHDCIGGESPRLVCRGCAARGSTVLAGWPYGSLGWYGYGYEYKSRTSIGAWPLVHVCAGIDPVTMRPRIARGVVAIGNIAVGLVAIGGVACGIVTLGGASLGLLLAVGGAALGLGLSIGGLAVGSIAIGGAAVGFYFAVGGGAVGPAVIDGRQCNDAAREIVKRWLDVTPALCR